MSNNPTIAELRAGRDLAAAHMRSITAKAVGRDLTAKEAAEFRELEAARDRLDEAIEYRERRGEDNPGAAAIRQAHARGDRSGGGGWATRAATAIRQHRGDGEVRALMTGEINLPQLVESQVVPMARPARLLDMLVNRTSIESNSFEYFRQSLRENNADVVADNEVKPTSPYGTDSIGDRVRVVAHIAEPVPRRLFDDHAELESFLSFEMTEGVLDALEAQVIAGDGEEENMTGILEVGGTRAVPFTTDAATTLRSALTVMQTAGEQPDAVVLHPGDAETIDLAREGTDGAFLLDGFTNGRAGSGNVFGDSSVQRIISPSVPEGTAVLGNWGQGVRLYVREATRLDINAGTPYFERNQVLLRAEGRFGIGVLRPSAFAIIDLVEA